MTSLFYIIKMSLSNKQCQTIIQQTINDITSNKNAKIISKSLIDFIHPLWNDLLGDVCYLLIFIVIL